MKSQVHKGKILEDFIVDRLRATNLDSRAYRQKGSGNGLNKGDIWNDLNLSFEAKNQKVAKTGKWMEQARKDSLGTTRPVVVWHPNGIPLEDSLVIIDWSFFEELLLKWKQPSMTNPDRQFKYKLERFVQYGKDLLKELS